MVQKAVKAVTGVGGFWVLITIPELRDDWLNKDLSRSFSLSIYKRHFAQLFDLVGWVTHSPESFFLYKTQIVKSFFSSQSGCRHIGGPTTIISWWTVCVIEIISRDISAKRSRGVQIGFFTGLGSIASNGCPRPLSRSLFWIYLCYGLLSFTLYSFFFFNVIIILFILKYI